MALSLITVCNQPRSCTASSEDEALAFVSGWVWGLLKLKREETQILAELVLQAK